jgi:hypothetical protein
MTQFPGGKPFKIILPVFDVQEGWLIVPMVGVKQQFVYNSIAPRINPGSEKNPEKFGVVPQVAFVNTPPLLVSGMLTEFTIRLLLLDELK